MKYRKIKIIIIILLLLVVLLSLYLYQQNLKKVRKEAPLFNADGRLLVSTTLFPVYDFAKNIGGEKVDVNLILPPGKEPHAFLPSEKETAIVEGRGLLFYTSDLMEPWLIDFVTKLKTDLRVESVANNLNDEKLDPHVWLDFTKAALMVEKISAVYQEIDPQNKDYYAKRTADYLAELSALDKMYSDSLKDCEFKGFIATGHDTFSYLAKRYQLDYQAAQGFIPTEEVDVERVLNLIDIIKDKKYPYIYYEELLMPHTGEIIRQQTGVKMLALNAAHNVGRYDIESGISFLSIMRNNLTVLKLGLKCH